LAHGNEDVWKSVSGRNGKFAMGTIVQCGAMHDVIGCIEVGARALMQPVFFRVRRTPEEVERTRTV
jgi:hypothetical protein